MACPGERAQQSVLGAGLQPSPPQFLKSSALCGCSCSLMSLLHCGLFRQRKGEGLQPALPGGCPQDRGVVEPGFYLLPTHHLQPEDEATLDCKVQVGGARGLSGRQGKDTDSTRVGGSCSHILPSCSHRSSSCLPAEHHVLPWAGCAPWEGLHRTIGQPSLHWPSRLAFAPWGCSTRPGTDEHYLLEGYQPGHSPAC